jgi:hypothetical protein
VKLRVFPETGRDLGWTLWKCLMILVGFMGVVMIIMTAAFLIRGHGL